MGSILINGSPTSEFKFFKGLKQGDPLSLVLFILIMESLHLSFKNVVNAGLYKGIPIDVSLILSHLFYDDDVVFVGKWDKMNVATIVNVLKSAESIGCSILTAPFNFLGVKVGDIMSRRSSWEETIGNGEGTSFWEDRWLSDLILKHLYPRVFRLELEKHVTVASKLRDIIAVEFSSHLLFSCHLARLLMLKVARWWELEVHSFNSYGDWLIWFNNIRLPSKLKEILEGICYVMWWAIWNFHNQVVLGANHPRLDLLFDDIICLSYTWCANRCKFKIDWNSWLKCPSSFPL
ncbi:hypothetical protein Tco_0190281 [Tanacetum coccineum]